MVKTGLIINQTQSKFFPPIPPNPNEPKKSHASNVSKTVDKVTEVSEKVWSYLGKMMTLTRHGLNLTLKSCERIAGSVFGVRITSAVAHLKFLSIIGLPFTIASIPDAIYKIFKNIQLKDKEGTALAGLSFAVIMTDFVDSVGTVVSAGFAIASKIPFEFISVIGMPVSFVLVGMSSLLKSIQLAKTCLLYNKLKKEVVSTIDHKAPNNKAVYQALWQFLDKKLGVADKKMASLIERMKELEKMPPEESAAEIQKIQKKLNLLLAQKRAKLQRAAPPDVVEKFEKIFELLKNNKELSDVQVKEILTDLDQIMAKFKKKMGVDIGNLIANALIIIGLCLLLSTAPAPLAIIFLAAALIIKICLQIYQDVDKLKAKKHKAVSV